MITNDSRNIVVADDSLFFRAKLSDVLTEAGHKVRTVNDGREVINEVKADSRNIDLLILDLQMPEVDGFEVLKWLGESGHRGEFPVLAVTGAYETSEVLERLKDLGASGFMSKDLPPEQIIFRVNRLLFTEKAEKGVPRERVPVSIPVDFTYGGITETGVIMNISEGGAFFFTNVDLSTGTELDMKFALPGEDAPMRVKGVVRWSPSDFESRIIFCGYGLIFTSLSKEDERAIKEFVAYELDKSKLI